ncbi:flagellar hook-length control protein FliK [Polymorphum gilvum]|uniref:Flagellar hook-length control protein, putative n=1 Tax=Polymorphum gilvum (strain LMG 25793 / CGMCC 1.9160 / SL003B-26A1) TaxID=991905 RepID=F2J4P5_POLGS|nr:flagellar hook-length control protein FliK [Polymorphum gilvum]ADZ72297.1 Flagellar hook-length control protein, putative [Polymorphum gilvum SL003B-26A1]
MTVNTYAQVQAFAAPVKASRVPDGSASGRQGGRDDGDGFTELLRKMAGAPASTQPAETASAEPGTVGGSFPALPAGQAQDATLAGLLPGGAATGLAGAGNHAPAAGTPPSAVDDAARELQVSADTLPAPAPASAPPVEAGLAAAASATARPMQTNGTAPAPVQNPAGGQSAALARVLIASDGTTSGSGGVDLSGVDDDGLFARFASAGEPVSTRAGAEEGEASGRPKVDIGQIRVLREETHFAPSMRLSPVQQIGGAISTALSETRPGNPAATFTARPDGPTVKVLQIQLQPMELGSVKVTMKMVGDAVEVVLQASNPDTVEVLHRDRHLLDQMLRATGHKPDAITIQAASDDRPMFQVTSTGSAQGGAMAEGDGPGAGPQLRGEGQGDRREHADGDDRAAENHQEQGERAIDGGSQERRTGRDRGAVYL